MNKGAVKFGHGMAKIGGSQQIKYSIENQCLSLPVTGFNEIPAMLRALK